MARPAEFDRTEVLEKAMEVFWRTGFNATSVADLVNATSLKPGSLYSAFQSKRGLFVEVIDTYAKRRVNGTKMLVQTATNPLDAIYEFFDRLRKDMTDDEIGRGCLMINTMLELATEDDDMRERVSNYLFEVEQEFIKALTKARDMQLLDASANPEQLARFMMTQVWGLRVLSSTRPDSNSYQQTIDLMLSCLPLKQAA